MTLLPPLGEGDDRTFIVFKLAVDVRTPHRARKRVAEALADWGLSDLKEDLIVCLSELVTNPVTQKADEIRVLLEWHAMLDLVEIAVWDDAPGKPERQEPSLEREGGRGLHIVEALSAEWGHHLGADGGKIIWARFPAAVGGGS